MSNNSNYLCHISADNSYNMEAHYYVSWKKVIQYNKGLLTLLWQQLIILIS